MTHEEFAKIAKELNLENQTLANMLGISIGAIYKWRQKSPPKYPQKIPMQTAIILRLLASKAVTIAQIYEAQQPAPAPPPALGPLSAYVAFHTQNPTA